MTDYIEDGGGRLYEVVEGELAQGEQYALVWQDIEPQIAAFEAGGMLRNDALDAALATAGRKSVFVRRIPNSADAAPSDGVHRVYLWNTDGEGNSRPGFLMRALERPSTSFYAKQRAGAEQLLGQVSTAIDAASVELAAIETELAAAKTLPEYQALVAEGKVDRQSRLQVEQAAAERAQTEAEKQIAYADDAVAAITALGPAAHGHSVGRLDAKIAEIRAARG